MEQVAYRVLIHGMVTGVGFRYSTLREAGRYASLSGHVRNASSSIVECVLQGPASEVEPMLQWLRHGPPSARVTQCDAEPIAVDTTLGPFTIAF